MERQGKFDVEALVRAYPGEKLPSLEECLRAWLLPPEADPRILKYLECYPALVERFQTMVQADSDIAAMTEQERQALIDSLKEEHERRICEDIDRRFPDDGTLDGDY